MTKRKRLIQIMALTVAVAASAGFFLIEKGAGKDFGSETGSSASRAESSAVIDASLAERGTSFSEGVGTEEISDVVATVLVSDSAPRERAPDFSLAATKPVDFDALAKYRLPVVVDYGSSVCIPCKRMAPALAAVNKEYRNKAFVKFADVRKYSNVASNVPVVMIPTQVFFNADGKPFTPSEALRKELNFTFHKPKKKDEQGFTLHVGELTASQLRRILSEMGANAND